MCRVLRTYAYISTISSTSNLHSCVNRVTTYAPLKRHGVTKGTRVGVVGVGGLGHLAIQWAAAMGAHVTAISTSLDKRDDALKLGATKFLVFTDSQQLQEANKTLDLILCSNNMKNNDWNAILSLLDTNGKVILVAAPEENLNIPPFGLILRQISVAGSFIGAKKEVEEMLQFASETGVRPWAQVIPMEKVNEGIKLMRENKVRYRVVLQRDSDDHHQIE